MKKKIAIITSVPLKNFIIKSVSEFTLECDFKVYSFDNDLNDVSNIYMNLPNDIDGILASGIFIERLITEVHTENTIPIISLKNDDTGIYKLFFNLLEKNRSLDISRIYADPFDGIELSLKEYLNSDLGQYPDILTNKLKSIPLDKIYEFEQRQYNKHLKLWSEGKIDISITRFGNLYNSLTEKSIPTYFLYPSDNHIRSCMTLLLQKIDLINMANSRPAVINITISKDYSVNSNFERDNLFLHQAILNFNNGSTIDYIVQKTRFGFEIFTDKKTINQQTSGFKKCVLNSFLKENLDFPVDIGYGIGENIYQARINASDANRESNLDKSNNSFLIDENNSLIILSQDSFTSSISNDLIDKLKRDNNIKLSPITIKKIIAVFDSMPDKQITSKDLAYKLNITSRSANRFLTAMEKSGVISVVKTKRTTTKGRPERVYELFI